MSDITPSDFIKLLDEDTNESGVIIKYRDTKPGNVVREMSDKEWRSKVLDLILNGEKYREPRFVAPNDCDDWTFHCYRVKPESGEECEKCGATENLGWANEDGAFKLCVGGCALECKIGSQWKTGGGWRAVVVALKGINLVVWHEKGDETYDHTVHGKKYGHNPEYNLVEPWTEPRSGVFWYNVYETRDGVVTSSRHLSRENADGVSVNRIACIRMPWTEGEGLGDEE